MTERVQVGLRVPKKDVRAFEDAIHENYGQKRPYTGTELERELRTFLEMGALDEIESVVDELVEAAGRRPADLSKNKSPEVRTPGDGDTKVVNYRINAEVRQKFMNVASETTTSAGRMLGILFQSYADGGTLGRIMDKLERIATDAKDLLSHVTDDSLSSVERNTIAICNELPDGGFKDGHLNAAIRDVHGDPVDQTIQDYRERVVDHLNVEPHPNSSGNRLWIPKEQSVEFNPDGAPYEVRQAPEMLTDSELVDRVHLLAGQDTVPSNGKGRFSYDDVREKFLDSAVSMQRTKEILKDVFMTGGFSHKEMRTGDYLCINLHILKESTDAVLLDEIMAYDEGLTVDEWRDEQHASADGETSQPVATDGGRPVE